MKRIDADRIFTPIARRYDLINRIVSLGRDQVWRKAVVDCLPDGDLLDLGAGTGAADSLFGQRRITALDPSQGMLALNRAHYRVAGIGETLPFGDASFDAVFSAYVFRNLTSIQDTMNEIARVLRPGGRVGIVDLSRPLSLFQRSLHRMGTAIVLPTVGILCAAPRAYWYLHRSLDKLPPPEEIYRGSPLSLERVWRMGAMGFVYGVLLEKPL